MASSSKKKTSGKKKSSGSRSYSKSKKSSGKQAASNPDFSWKTELALFVVLAVSIILFIGMIGKGGVIGGLLGGFFFGVFGVMAYVFPFLLFIFTAFLISNLNGDVNNRGVSGRVVMKSVAVVLMYLFLCAFCHLISNGRDETSPIGLYQKSASFKNGGGLIGGLIGGGLCRGVGLAGAVVIILLVLCLCVVLITEKSLFKSMHIRGRKVYEKAAEDKAQRESVREEKLRLKEEEKRADERSARRGRGVTLDTRIEPEKEEVIPEVQPEEKAQVKKARRKKAAPAEDISLPVAEQEITDVQSDDFWQQFGEPTIKMSNPEPTEDTVYQPLEEPSAEEEIPVKQKRTRNPKQQQQEVEEQIQDIGNEIESADVIPEKEYVFPDVELLQKGDPNATGDSRKHLQEMSAKLQLTLTNFGVNARVTNVVCGPTVTQYEIQPEMGVKVSKILNLADDIKLNLAVADIRIEAPIPGKAAIGIEVPNKENVTVAFRDMVESKEFKEHPSHIAFCAGKDIAGNVIVADIAKMPHVLIAGSTGSGKSVCINTIIMSILYRANPEDVKLIMIDPKVVELSVYNGIPHLLIPVVTDPKKAAGALHWAVAEMTDRYQKFAEYGVRDIKGYNKKADIANADVTTGDKVKKMPQIVVIVDELADLMMVAPGDVEDAICRLAQLARAAGIHLIIATQRPSVNVITGLIKANMPSRIAFAVTSGVDSRTILDMNGAEKLLGKGDMLFYPQGYAKPLRVQGAFVTDKEVADVVQYIVEKNGEVSYNSDVEEKVKSTESFMGGGGGFSSGNDRDSYFKEAGAFIIEKEKGSIGMLQRMFKIGFNRAARIMDQLEEAGVVGPEEGTKPRKVLMTMAEFEQIADD